MSLSDEWFANKFLEINNRLAKIEEKVDGHNTLNRRGIRALNTRVRKVEESIEDCDGFSPMNKDWKWWSKKITVVGTVISMMAYMVWDLVIGGK